MPCCAAGPLLSGTRRTSVHDRTPRYAALRHRHRRHRARRLGIEPQPDRRGFDRRRRGATRPGKSVNDVTEVRITKADRSQATLQRNATNWSVGERAYPADSGKLRKLLLDLGSLQAVERKTSVARNYPVLGVADVTQPKATGARIDIVSRGKTWSLIVGNSMDANNCYVRVVDSAQSLLASPLIMVDADPKLWLDPAIVDIAPDRISEVEELPAKGSDSTSRATARLRPTSRCTVSRAAAS